VCSSDLGKYPAWKAPEKWDIEVSSRIVDALMAHAAQV
jgi:hypothetical protein